ncbi:MAG: hypothetical protein IJ911_03965 [Salinivirgaceae bacterium]|nr:hypothetical protein [Salinivirgaceae bacterium]
MTINLFSNKKKSAANSVSDKSADTERLLRLAEVGLFSSVDELIIKAKMLKLRQN